MNRYTCLVWILIVQVLMSYLPAYAQNVVSIFGQYAPRSVAVEFARANDLMNKKKYKEAEPIIKSLVSEAPKLGAVRFLNAKILYQNKKFNESYAEAQNAVKINPTHANSYITLGNSALAIGKKQDALLAYQKYLKLNPNTQRAKKVQEFVRLLKNEMSMLSKSTIKSPPGTYLQNVTVYGVARFTKDKMPLKVFISSGADIKCFNPSYIESLKKSFRRWQSKSNQLVSFQFVDSNQSADIECHWTDSAKKLITPLEGGHCRFSDSEFGRVTAEIILLLVRNGKPVSNLEVERVALHEIGHAIGLNGHSNSKKDVMFMTVDSDPVLSKADIATLEALYKLKPTKPRSNITRVGSAPRVYAKGGKHQAIVAFNEGNTLLKAKKFASAETKFRQAIKLDPSFKGASFNLSVALNGHAAVSARAGNLDLAEKQIVESIALMRKFGGSNSKLSVFLNNYKIILNAKGKKNEALKIDEELSSLSKQAK